MANLDYIKPSVKDKLLDFEFMRDMKIGWKNIVGKKTKYLPKQPNENDIKYNARWEIATYEDFFSVAVDGIKGLVFKKQIKFNDDVPQQLQDIMDNANGEGDSFNIVAGELFEGGLDKGIHFALVDMPRGQANNRAEEIAQNIRPYITLIMAENVTSWKTDIVNGLTVLTQVKIREWVEEDVEGNSFATELKEYWRVLWLENNVVNYRLYDSQDAIIEEGNLGNINFIPLFALNLKKTAYFESDIPFYDLAKLNISHYQILSDSRYSAHTACVPVPYASGVSEDEVKNLVVSPNSLAVLSDPQAKLGFLDYDGKGVAVNETLLQRIERRIYQLGFSVVMTEKEMTATESMIEGQQKQSKLNAWVAELKDTLENILNAMAIMGGYGDNGGTVTIDADILSNPLDAQEFTAVINAMVNQKVSFETGMNMIRTGRMMLPEDFDIEVEKYRVSQNNLSMDNTNNNA